MVPDNKKTFSLKPIEQQLLHTQQESYFNSLSNILSFIALERLAYHVTENTRFKWDEDKLEVWEDEPQTPEAEVIETAPSNLPKGK